MSEKVLLTSDYISIRKKIIVITLFILFIGSIVYFATDVAERNNEMMYKEIYGENATWSKADRGTDIGVDIDLDVKKALV